MIHTQTQMPTLLRTPRPSDASCQDTQAALYRAWVRALTMAAFTLTFLGWLRAWPRATHSGWYRPRALA